MKQHLMKLVVGLDSLEEFAKWQKERYELYRGQKVSIIYTRYKPKQAEEILKTEGSIYRIIKGYMCCRQRIVGFDTQYTESGKKCLIFTDPEIISVYPMKHRPFQGWRYLKDIDVPADVGFPIR